MKIGQIQMCVTNVISVIQREFTNSSWQMVICQNCFIWKEREREKKEKQLYPSMFYTTQHAEMLK